MDERRSFHMAVYSQSDRADDEKLLLSGGGGGGGGGNGGDPSFWTATANLARCLSSSIWRLVRLRLLILGAVVSFHWKRYMDSFALPTARSSTCVWCC